MRKWVTYKAAAMKGKTCITNNRLILDICPEAVFIEGSPEEVYLQARDLIHKGWKFVAHPQYGNFNPARHPYRTLILSEPEGVSPPLDLESFALLESALEKFISESRQTTVKGQFDDDYALLDRELIKSVMAQL